MSAQDRAESWALDVLGAAVTVLGWAVWRWPVRACFLGAALVAWVRLDGWPMWAGLAALALAFGLLWTLTGVMRWEARHAAAVRVQMRWRGTRGADPLPASLGLVSATKAPVALTRVSWDADAMRLRLRLVPGITAATVEAKSAALADALGGIRAIVSPLGPGAVEVRVLLRDPLADPVAPEWVR